MCNLKNNVKKNNPDLWWASVRMMETTNQIRTPLTFGSWRSVAHWWEPHPAVEISATSHMRKLAFKAFSLPKSFEWYRGKLWSEGLATSSASVDLSPRRTMNSQIHHHIHVPFHGHLGGYPYFRLLLCEECPYFVGWFPEMTNTKVTQVLLDLF